MIAWTEELPTLPGEYWCVVDGQPEPLIANLVDRHGIICAAPADDGEPCPVSQLTEFKRWAGPIEESCRKPGGAYIELAMIALDIDALKGKLRTLRERALHNAPIINSRIACDVYEEAVRIGLVPPFSDGDVWRGAKWAIYTPVRLQRSPS